VPAPLCAENRPVHLPPARVALLTLTLLGALTAPPVLAAPPASAAGPRLAAAPRVLDAPSAAGTAVLRSRIARALVGSTATTVGVAVDVDGAGPVYRRNALVALPPASTQKTYVAAAALLALPATVRARTQVAATATVTLTPPVGAVPAVAGVLPGDLWLVPGGDAYLTGAGLRELARAVRTAGITTVTGALRLDDSRYDAVRGGSGWRSTWVGSQSGPLSAFALDGNRWRRDRAFLRDPALPNTARFRDLLRAEGVTVRGPVVRGRRPAAARPVAERLGAPLAQVTARLLKSSDNFAAELLLKEIGHRLRGDGSTRGGAAAVRHVLGARGVPVGATADGSGLSRWDRQTPAGQVRLLQAVALSHAAVPLRDGLPVACVDGTLRRRMCRTAAAGVVRAKTGTLRGVITLSGYATTSRGRQVRFAVQMSGVRSGVRARAAVDRVAAVLASTRL
jgi:D-alanyl-D-alanine carboxypeptidase/D-alanyl-D-alanine-endopeptidase (penicillin-binding protein 4)